MKCPKCDSSNSDVIDSRPAHNDTEIRRRRACVPCGHRWSTYEKTKAVKVKSKVKTPISKDSVDIILERIQQLEDNSATMFKHLLNRYAKLKVSALPTKMSLKLVDPVCKHCGEISKTEVCSECSDALKGIKRPYLAVTGRKDYSDKLLYGS